MRWKVRCKISYFTFDVVFDTIEEAGEFAKTIVTKAECEKGEEMYATIIFDDGKERE